LDTCLLGCTAVSCVGKVELLTLPSFCGL
jgi:hypothetical protein